MYLDLMKRALRHELYWPPDLDYSNDFVVEEFAQAVRDAKAAGTLDVSKARAEGRSWPKFGQTMVGEYRLDNVHQCVETALAEGIPGDLIETGVWRGGATILMRAVLAAHDIHDRTVFVADSFRGLPPPNTSAYPADTVTSTTPRANLR